MTTPGRVLIAQAQDTINALKTVCYSKLDDSDVQDVGAQTLSALDSSIKTMQYASETLKKKFHVCNLGCELPVLVVFMRDE